MGSTFDDVCTESLMVTKAVAAVTPQWFGHPGVEVESPQLRYEKTTQCDGHLACGLFGARCLAVGSFLDLRMA